MAASIFLARMAKSREEHGDVTLRCEGKEIKAHSLILHDRSEYFKSAEAFNTAAGNTTKVIEVEECPYDVLKMVIDFMYGIDLPRCSADNVESLVRVLTMANLYLMEDLKDAVSARLAAHLNKNNIMQIYDLAEKYRAVKLKEICKDFIVACMSVLEMLGVDAADISKERKQVDGGWTYPSQVLKKNMIVRCKTDSKWYFDPSTKISTVKWPGNYKEVNWPSSLQIALCKAETLGRIVVDKFNNIGVVWRDHMQTQGHRCKHARDFPNPAIKCAADASFSLLEIVTPDPLTPVQWE